MEKGGWWKRRERRKGGAGVGGKWHKIPTSGLNITTDATSLQRIIREYCKQFYTSKFVNWDETDTFTERYKLSKDNTAQTENWNSPVSIKQI